MNIKDLAKHTPVKAILAKLVLNDHKDNEDWSSGVEEVEAVCQNFNANVKTDETIREFAPTWASRFLKELCFT